MTSLSPRQKDELSPVARHIARAAARLFAERGYDATSVREIVEAAGVAKPTLYYYFPEQGRAGPGLADGSALQPGRDAARIVTHGGRPDRVPGAGHRGPVRLLPRRPGPRAGSSMPCSSARSARKLPASWSRSRTACGAGPTRRCAGSPKWTSCRATASRRVRPPAAG